MSKIKFKILVLLILFSSTLTIDGSEFFHNHDTESDNHCISCIISSSLVADNPYITDFLTNVFFPDFTIDLPVKSLINQHKPFSFSERAPPKV